MFDEATSLELRKKAKEARIAQGISQKELANRIGLSQGGQSQISDFETGTRKTLSEEKIRLLCKELDVEIPETSPSIDRRAESAIAFCSDPWCPGATVRTLPRHVLVKPTIVRADLEGARNCRLCGEVLVRKCERCGKPVESGVCCRQCGENYVETPEDWQKCNTDQLRAINECNREFLSAFSTGER